MKIATTIAGVLLGLMFIAASVMVLFKLGPTPPPPPEGTPPALFMAAFAPTGYLTFVKIFELLGGVLVAIPRTRNLGLLVLGPIIINILAFHIFVTGGEGLWNLFWHDGRPGLWLGGQRRFLEPHRARPSGRAVGRGADIAVR